MVEVIQFDYRFVGKPLDLSRLISVSQCDGLAINRAVGELLLANRKWTGLIRAQLVSGDLILDGFGTPIHFAATNCPIRSKLHPTLAQEVRWPYFVWPAGANKSNEFGYGDDIFWR